MIFDTNVQELKYRVLKAVAEHAYAGTIDQAFREIPMEIVPGKEATMRCCVYKERAIVVERVKLAMGGERERPGAIEVIPIACDECPRSSYTVSDYCRGCIAHRCVTNCPVGAISIVDHRAQIDPAKCIQCGKCASACPYNAIYSYQRPCEAACKIKAIGVGEEGEAVIDEERCISCGACVNQCPFGAIVDKSYILDAIQMLQESLAGGRKAYAIVAPSIASQFQYATLGQVITGIKRMGFQDVIEAALGADMVADKEAMELVEKGFLTSSCCPAFVAYIEKEMPQMAQYISHNLSPMAEIAQLIKKTDPQAQVIFIGPCTAKKMEAQKPHIRQLVDCVLTFEELQALIDANGIVLSELEESLLDNASYFGRIFARSGGLSDAVAEALKEHGVGPEQFQLRPAVYSGIEACRLALLKASKGALPENFIEGMACIDGCIGGAGCLTHGPKNKGAVDKYGKLAMEKNIQDAISVYDLPQG